MEQTAYNSLSGVNVKVNQNRVMRNTMGLLAMTMIPTALGALLGVYSNFSLLQTSPILGLILFLGGSWLFMFAIQRNAHKTSGVYLLLAFTGFMGLILSEMLQSVLTLSNGGQIIVYAALMTSVIFMSMYALAPRFAKASQMGGFLFVGLIVIIIASVVNMFLQMPILALVISSAAVFLFACYTLYDLRRIIDGGETNYVMATLSIYLDVYNLFVHLLSLLSMLMGRRE